MSDTPEAIKRAQAIEAETLAGEPDVRLALHQIALRLATAEIQLEKHPTEPTNQ